MLEVLLLQTGTELDSVGTVPSLGQQHPRHLFLRALAEVLDRVVPAGRPAWKTR